MTEDQAIKILGYLATSSENSQLIFRDFYAALFGNAKARENRVQIAKAGAKMPKYYIEFPPWPREFEYTYYLIPANLQDMAPAVCEAMNLYLFYALPAMGQCDEDKRREKYYELAEELRAFFDYLSEFYTYILENNL